MKKLALVILLSTLVFPARATTYYLATAAGGGSDSNNGMSASTPWLTPNHAVNCGDVILAAASSSYAYANFRANQWGAVTCTAGNNVAWLKCVTFDACKMTVSGSGRNAMTLTQSYWGVQGWEITATAETNQCFEAFPPDQVTQIHHIIFANNIANGCYDGAFGAGSANSSIGVDYLAIIGNIAYKGAQGADACFSGIDIVTPKNSDALPGTHDYIAGNFSWDNVDPNPCSGGAPTDGEGVLLDTISPYSGQIVVDNNISIFNGGFGIEAYYNQTGSPNAPIYFRHNTTYGNQVGSINASPCSEAVFSRSYSSQAYLNLFVTDGAATCLVSGSPQTVYAFAVGSPNSTDQAFNNFIYSAAGNNTTGSGTGSTYRTNLTGTSPNFSNPVEPGVPNCGGYASVPACMATVIANFTPTTTAAKAYGYKAPSTTQTSDALFPQWLCHVTNLPAGLVTMGCLAQPSLPAAPTTTAVTVR